MNSTSRPGSNPTHHALTQQGMKDSSPKSPGQMRTRLCPIETTAGEDATLPLNLEHGDAALLERTCAMVGGPVSRPGALLGLQPATIEQGIEELHTFSAS